MSKKELKFIHITKTGGTSIEDEGKNYNINWGRYHEEYGWWHEIFIDKPQELKDKYDWFMVVRNPYERILSEFHCKWGGVGRDKEAFLRGIYYFNRYLKEKIRAWDKPTSTKHGISRGDHYTPQHLYLDNNSTTHILKMENLKEEFDNLMSEYDLDIKLNTRTNVSEKEFGIQHMDKELIQLIQEVYHEDFVKFGYSKEPPYKRENKFIFNIPARLFNIEGHEGNILFYNYTDYGNKIICYVFKGENEEKDYLEIYDIKNYPEGGLKNIDESTLKKDSLISFLRKEKITPYFENENIAFCFLTYGDIENTHTWRKFFNKMGSNYNVYLHPKESKEVSNYFYPHIIKDRVETEWGGISLVRATNNLFREAFKDESNKVFILLSDKCIPIHTPEIIKRELLTSKSNRMGIMGDMDSEGRYNTIKDKSQISKDNFEKRSQWMVLNRDTVGKLLEIDKTELFEDVFAPDEVYYPTMLNMLGIDWEDKTLTFSNWIDISHKGNKNNYPKTYDFISFKEIEKIRETGALFMRKVTRESDFEIYNIY